MSNPADEILQAERRRIMAEERRGKTLMGHAQDTETELGGRFAKVHSTTVIGLTPGPIYPQQPPGSRWAKDDCPPEPSLGYAIDQQEPVGEKHEIEASQTTPESRLVMSPVADGVGGGGPGDGTSLRPATKFRRRA